MDVILDTRQLFGETIDSFSKTDIPHCLFCILLCSSHANSNGLLNSLLNQTNINLNIKGKMFWE